MKSIVKHIPTFYLFALLAGTLFFVPAIFVSRFTTAPALWMQAGVSVGIIGPVFHEKRFGERQAVHLAMFGTTGFRKTGIGIWREWLYC